MEVSRAVEALRRIGRGHLARLLKTRGDEKLEVYARSLWSHQPGCSWEPAMRDAFGTAFLRGGYDAPSIARVLQHLSTRRTLQTAPHLTLSQGPVLFASNAVAALGGEAGEPLVVGACSGI